MANEVAIEEKAVASRDSLDEQLNRELEAARKACDDAKANFEATAQAYKDASAELEKLEARVGHIQEPAPFIAKQVQEANNRARSAAEAKQRADRDYRVAQGKLEELKLARQQLDGKE